MTVESDARDRQSMDDADLSAPHRAIPAWTRRETYDRITAMYLDCWDDAEIARELSEGLSLSLTADAVEDIRVEAAMAAESQPHEVRLRWIYRFRRLTPNNLAKEYMCLEGTRDFAAAKRTLAEEIDGLARTTPPARLCIAVNDAMGRNNIDAETLLALQAYAKVARQTDTLLRSCADKQRRSLEEMLADTADQVAAWHETNGNGDTQRTAGFLAAVLKQPASLVTPANAEYLLEYRRLRHESAAGAGSFVSCLVAGADLEPLGHSVLDSILQDGGLHLPYTALRQLSDTVRSGAVMGRQELESIRRYASRHLRDIETLRDLGKQSTVPEPVLKLQIQALETLRGLVSNHLSLRDPRVFFTPAELLLAAKQLIPPGDLQTCLDHLNVLSSRNEITACLATPSNRMKAFPFPTDRYLERRFRLPVPDRPATAAPRDAPPVLLP